MDSKGPLSTYDVYIPSDRHRLCPGPLADSGLLPPCQRSSFPAEGVQRPETNGWRIGGVSVPSSPDGLGEERRGTAGPSKKGFRRQREREGELDLWSPKGLLAHTYPKPFSPLPFFSLSQPDQKEVGKEGGKQKAPPPFSFLLLSLGPSLAVFRPFFFSPPLLPPFSPPRKRKIFES